MKAVVMAGGEGTRLRPLTSNQPKPMVPIVGKPCMEHIVELLKRHGFEDVIVTVAFLPQAIRSYFGSGENLGVDIGYSVEESPLGTAGSVKRAAAAIGEGSMAVRLVFDRLQAVGSADPIELGTSSPGAYHTAPPS